MQKIKTLLKAALVISVTLALILPGSAVVTNNTTAEKNSFGATRTTAKVIQKLTIAENRLSADNIILPGEGDDILPSICTDPYGNVVVTSTNQPSFSEGNMNIWYSSTPNDPYTWAGWVMTLSGYSMFFDTAHIKGPLEDDHDYLMGVFMEMGDELSGYYEIDNVATETPETDWLFWNWDGGAPEPQYACITDGGYYEDLNYPGYFGPFNFFIHREIYDVYDIPFCPIFFHTDIRGDQGGVGYFDGQTKELTAPAADPDYVDLGDRYHTAIQYNDPAGDAKIVWKKVVPAEQPDYEFTAYQDTIATGENPAIAAYGNNVAIVYVSDGTVNCIHSSDDGVNWDTNIVASGKYPDIFAYESKYYCAYINDNNLFLKSSVDGVSWSAAEQINTVDGSVADDENSVDINVGGIVWVDESGADKDIAYMDLGLGGPANQPPGAPTITGPNGKPGTSYEYSFNAVDPDGDQIAEYVITWGDGQSDTLTGPFASGAVQKKSHTFAEEGEYTITAHAKDVNGLIGADGTLKVNMPRTRTIFLRFLDYFPHAFPVLRMLLGL